MANEIKWENLTSVEEEALEKLTSQGVDVYASPIVIEDEDQLHALGLTWNQCKTWRVGNQKHIVHLTPTDKETYDMLLRSLRTNHSREYRSSRCRIPGKQKELIMCPECNECSNCPYPQYRDNQRVTELSWDELIDSGYEDAGFHNVGVKIDLEAVCKVIDAQNPLFTKAMVLKECYGLSVNEIAKQLNTTPRNIYFYLSEAKRIGKQWKSENDS